MYSLNNERKNDMRIKVECAMRFIHKNMIEALEKNENPKFVFVGMDPKSKITMLFDVETDRPANEICDLAKKIIKNSEMGKTASFRVIE